MQGFYRFLNLWHCLEPLPAIQSKAQSYRLMEKLMERYEDEIDLREARKAFAEAKEKGFIPWEQVKSKTG